MEASSLELATIKEDMFNTAMRGEWEEVIRIYERDHRAHQAKITRSGDTALHVAVSDGRLYIVEELVRQIVAKHSRPESVLDIRNDRGNTALHLAAAMGNVRMCKCIAEIKPSLVGSRNEDGETPLFLAAFRGKKKAFLCLHAICGPELDASYYLRKDGQTVLHCAITGEYFDLAFQIIHLHRELVNSVDKDGLSPLHILASKPFAFKSGSNLGPWYRIIYHSTFVDELKPAELPSLLRGFEVEKKLLKCPENYRTCVNVYKLLRYAIRVVRDDATTDAENPVPIRIQNNENQATHFGRRRSFPENYVTFSNFVKLICKAILVVLGYGHTFINIVREEKEKHVWAVQVLHEILRNLRMYDYLDQKSGANLDETGDTDRDDAEIFNSITEETRDEVPKLEATKKYRSSAAILIAASNGVTEIVKAILKKYPIAMEDTDSEGKNIVLLAIEKRQPETCTFLFEYISRSNWFAFHRVDHKGNSALHLAATLPSSNSHPWPVASAASQMQWELNWFQFIKNSLPKSFLVRYNNQGETAHEIFMKTHNDLLEAGGKWLTEKSTACSVVIGLFVTIAFATSATIPGGTDDNGEPKLEKQPVFKSYAISSLVALYSSVTAVVMFLAILTSGYQVKDFHKSLPRKLLLGLTCFYLSVASTLISFCSGHFFILKNELKTTAFPVYAITCLFVIFYAVAQFPLYFQLVWATFKKVPVQRGFNPDTLFFS